MFKMSEKKSRDAFRKTEWIIKVMSYLWVVPFVILRVLVILTAVYLKDDLFRNTVYHVRATSLIVIIV